LKILLVYPQYPDTFWSFKHALNFIRKKAAFPPLGLITVAAMLPADWEKRLVDLNVRNLTDTDIKWADYVFISAMAVQRESVKEIIKQARKLGAKTVAGGPLFTTEPEQFEDIDHLVLGEAEITLPLFLTDLENSNLKHFYTTDDHPEVTMTPSPMWSLIDMNKYVSMNIQYSRGCPFNCEFCDITALYGRVPRTKSKEQIIGELDDIYQRGWRGAVFVVDDNFIGNKNKLKSEILPAIIEWQEKRKHPYLLFTEVSINLADDAELMRQMSKAGFCRVFIGIETPNEASLTECNKNQNKSRDMVAAVKTIQNNGMEVMGGFIIGFDNDPASIFRAQINFIQKSGIVTAMVGLLNAPKGTRLYQRLKGENRLLKEDFSGNNMDSTLNFEPKMNREKLIDGYHQVLNTIYSPQHYYARIKVLLREYKPKAKVSVSSFHFSHVVGLINCMWFLGIREKGRRYYWRLFASTLFTKPRSFSMFVSLAAYGYHFRKIISRYIRTPSKSTV
jgi:radical SAM superfamily enzyme YgiQ (UPF0313 family)